MVCKLASNLSVDGWFYLKSNVGRVQTQQRLSTNYLFIDENYSRYRSFAVSSIFPVEKYNTDLSLQQHCKKQHDWLKFENLLSGKLQEYALSSTPFQNPEFHVQQSCQSVEAISTVDFVLYDFVIFNIKLKIQNWCEHQKLWKIIYLNKNFKKMKIKSPHNCVLLRRENLIITRNAINESI